MRTPKRYEYSMVKTLMVRCCGKHHLWTVERWGEKRPYNNADEVLVFLFGSTPIFTRSYQAAMRLAAYCHVRAFTEKTESRDSPAGTNRIQGLCWSGGQHGWRNRIRRICAGALLVRGKMALPSRKLRSNLE